MKFNKIYTLLLAAAMFTGCSDDDESWNSGTASVNMGQTELSFKENKGIVNIPITVDGELNGPIQVVVEVAETGANPAMDDIHYIVTSKTVVIPADATSGNIEMSTVDDNEINEARTFTMSIKSVEGATVGSNASAVITLKDNDAAFYEKLQGKWTFVGYDRQGAETTYDLNIVGYEEGESGYDQTLYATGIMGYSWTQLELKYYFDMETKKASVSIPMGTLFAEGVDFGFANLQNVYAVTAVNGQLSMSGEIMGTINDDFTEITFEEGRMLYGALFDSVTGSFDGYTWFSYHSIKFTK